MAKFVLQQIPSIQGKQRFFTLNQCDVCPYETVCLTPKQDAQKKHNCSMGLFDHFQEDCIRRHPGIKGQLITVLSRMQLVAELKTLPNEKFKNITPKGEKTKEFEIKTPDLRVYMFQLDGHGKIVVVGGIKGTQDSDIKHFRFLKKQFLKQMNANTN